jgi:CRP-like cAMP-binding protein
MIEEELLYQFGAELKHFEKNAVIFSEGQSPNYYYQIKEGTIKLNNFKDDGKEFIQNIFYQKQSFGESLLFLDSPYPMNAISLSHSQVFLLTKTKFHELLDTYSQVSQRLNKILSQRLYYKYKMLLNLSSTDPQMRLLGLMDYLKSFQQIFQKEQADENFYEIPLTRQQLANLTGLCVETVIRTIKKMEVDNRLKLEGRKIYY